MQNISDAGELVVSHGGVECVFDFAPASADTTKLQWAAMYGNCLHEIKGGDHYVQHPAGRRLHLCQPG
jgi:hypothetical protein